MPDLVLRAIPGPYAEATRELTADRLKGPDLAKALAVLTTEQREDIGEALGLVNALEPTDGSLLDLADAVEEALSGAGVSVAPLELLYLLGDRNWKAYLTDTADARGGEIIGRWVRRYGAQIRVLIRVAVEGSDEWNRIRVIPVSLVGGQHRLRVSIQKLSQEEVLLETSTVSLLRLVRALVEQLAVLPADHLSELSDDDGVASLQVVESMVERIRGVLTVT